MICLHNQALYLQIYLLDGFTNVCIHMILIQTTCSMYACFTTESFHTSNTIAFTPRVKLLQKITELLISPPANFNLLLNNAVYINC